jgi:imidazolonepropionase-like amidohydrolase
MRAACALILIAGAACSGKSQPPATPSDGAIAIRDVTVIPMDRDGALPHQTVIVRGDRIVAVGPVASTAVPKGATTIDGAGKWLIPGLVDMHVHTYDPQALAMFVSMGVTTVRVMWGAPAVLGAREAIRNGEPRLAPSIYTSGDIVDGDPTIWPSSIPLRNAAEATAEVERQHRAGYDYIKVYSRLTPEAYDAVVAAAGRLGMPVIGHVPNAVGLADVLTAKQRSTEHLDGFARFTERDDSPIKDEKSWATRATAYKYADEAKITDAIARVVASGGWTCPTLVVMDRISHLDKPDTTRPEYAYVPPASIASWDPKQDFRFQAWTADQFVALRGTVTWNGSIVKRLADAGAPIVAGTDVGNPWLVPGYSLHDELGLLVGAGLTTAQALKAATVNPADFFAARGELGSIAAGARADLVLLDGDPLADIAATRAIAGVMLRGRWLPAAELAAERDRIAAIYRGDRSRFADVAPAAPSPSFTAVYRGNGPYVSGEERVTAVGTRLIGESRLDNDGEARWELELGPAGTGVSLRAMQDGLDLTMTRDGGRVRISGAFGADTLAIDDAIADDEILGGSPLGIDVAWHRAVAGIPAVGGTRTVKVAVLDLRPPRVNHMTVTATRKADATRTVGGAAIPVRVFAVEVFGQTTELALDAQGYAVESATHIRQ